MKADLFKQKNKEMAKLINKGQFMLLLIIVIISAALFIYAPLSLNKLIKDVGTIGTLDIVKVLGILALGYLVDFLSVFVKNRLIQDYHTKACKILYDSIFKLNYDKYLEIGPTALRNYAVDCAEGYASFYFDVIPTLIVSILMIVATIIVSFTFSTLAAILMFITLPIYYFGFKVLNKVLSKLSINLRDAWSLSSKNIHSIISQVDFIKQNPDNSTLIPPIEENTHFHQGVRKSVNYVANGASGLLIGLNQIIQTLIIVYLSSLALKNNELFGGVLYIIMIMPYFSSAIRQLSSTNLGFAELNASKEILKNFTDNVEDDGSLNAPQRIEKIKFDIPEVKVGDKTLMRNVKMEFKKGDIIGVKGESGKGKSTLLKLIPKFRDSNGIWVNDVPVRDIKNSDYLKHVSYFSQNLPIITDTLLNNLNFGRKPLSENEYRKLNFLKKFDNLNEEIVENGANLSGGDKQRVAMSRYFTEEADIVILDEPTSSLDKATEDEIMHEILKDTKDRIIFIISHNPDIMKFCNYVVEIKDEKAVLTKNN